MNISTREDIVSIIPNKAIGAELGVFEGDYSQILLDSKKFSKLYLVDLFDGVASSGDKYGNNIKTYTNASLLFDHNIKRFANNPQVEILKQNSVSFLNSVNNYLDFVYIDTVHTYEFTLLELEAARSAVKKGGIISGHDYNEQYYRGLVNAVSEFCQKYKLKYFVTQKDILNSFIIMNT